VEKFPGLPQAEKATKSKVHSKARSASDVTLSLPAKPKVGLRSLLSVVGTVVALALARPLNAMAMGDDTARALGANLNRTRALSMAAATVLCGAATAACGPMVDLTKGLEVTIINSGWYDLGIVNGQNKLVPSVTFTLRNVSDQTLGTLQVQALFRRVTENTEWGNGFLTVVGSKGLAPGATTDPITIKSQLGYTGSDQSRQEMLANTHFVDAKVELFGKYASTQWARLGSYPVTRQVLSK